MGFITTAVWVGAAIIWGNEFHRISGAVEALLGVLLYLPSVLVPLWSHRQPALASWHWGKLLLPWIAALALSHIGAIWEAAPLTISSLALPLFALTWGWLSHRGDQQPSAESGRPPTEE